MGRAGVGTRGGKGGSVVLTEPARGRSIWCETFPRCGADPPLREVSEWEVAFSLSIAVLEIGRAGWGKLSPFPVCLFKLQTKITDGFRARVLELTL